MKTGWGLGLLIVEESPCDDAFVYRLAAIDRKYELSILEDIDLNACSAAKPF